MVILCAQGEDYFVMLTPNRRHQAARMLLVLITLYGVLMAISNALPPPSDSWSVEKEIRFRALRPYLPSRGEIGFFTDAVGEERWIEGMLLQHALAPLVVRLDPDCCPVAVAILSTPYPGIPGYDVMHDLGQGLWVLTRQ